MPSRAVVERLDVVEQREPQIGPGRERSLAADELLLSVEKKLSATALSKQSPRLPIEMAMPASRAAWPKARLTYCPDSRCRRNTGLLVSEP